MVLSIYYLINKKIQKLKSYVNWTSNQRDKDIYYEEDIF